MKMNIIINKNNITSVSKKINEALKKNIKDVCICYPLKNTSSLQAEKLVKYKEVDFFDSLLYFNQFINIYLRGFPLCVLPSRDFFRLTVPYRGKFSKKCLKCKEKANCYGAPSVYLNKFGDSELKPFIEEDYLLINDWKKDEKKVKMFWKLEKERQKPIWEYYFKNIQGKILDVGAGIGVFLDFAPKRIIGIDSDKDKLNSAIRKTKKIDLRYGNATHLDFKSNYFTGVCCHFVLEHLSSPQIVLALKEMKRVLKRGGKLFIMVAGKDEQNVWYNVGHKTLFTKKKLEDLVKKLNFKKYKIFNEKSLRAYKEFNFNQNLPDDNIKEIALCLIAEK